MPTFCDHCGDIIIEDCECMVCDSDCISVDGKGDALRPFTFAPLLDPDGDNVASCSTSGLLAIPPSYILDPPRCSITHSANQSNPDDTDLVLSFDTENYDTDTMHDTVTNNDLVTFTTAGIYIISAYALFAANATGDRKLAIYKNGVHQIGHAAKSPASVAFDTGIELTIQEKFEAGDTIRVRTRQDSGGALNVLTGNGSPSLEVKFLRTLPT